MVLQDGYGLAGGWVVVCFGIISFLIIYVISGWVLVNRGVGFAFVLGVGLRLIWRWLVGFLVLVGGLLVLVHPGISQTSLLAPGSLC